jgi:hypothetical protein
MPYLSARRASTAPEEKAMRIRTSLVSTFVLLAAGAAWAQEAGAPAGPPPVMAIRREEIKPGRMEAHQRQAALYVSVLDRANAGEHRLALVPLSGDDNQVIYLEGFPSLAAMGAAREGLDKAALANAALRSELEGVLNQGGEDHNSQRTILARLRADLSYRPLSNEQVGRMRYVSMQTIRVKLGRVPDYTEWLKPLNEARQKAGVEDLNVLVYQVTSGAPQGTLITFTGYRSLEDMDAVSAGMQDRDAKVNAALGGPDVVKQRRTAMAEMVQDVTTTLFAIDPVISRAPTFIAAADPEFWGRKLPAPAAPAKALAGKKVKK